MTEEQNKLAERLDQLRNQMVMNRGLHIDDHQSFCAHLGEIIAALREPATDAVLNDVIDRLGEEYAGEDFAGDTDAWNMTVGHCIEVVRAALKGKGASQGVAAETYRIKSVAMGPHVTGAAPTYTGEGVSMLQVPSAAPEPSGEGIFCCLCGKNIYSGEQTKLIDFDEWEAGVRKHSFQKRIAHASCPASTDEQKG